MDKMFYPADPYLVGAAASAFYVNDAATVLPKAIVAKARTYLAGVYADVLEVCCLLHVPLTCHFSLTGLFSMAT